MGVTTIHLRLVSLFVSLGKGTSLATSSFRETAFSGHILSKKNRMGRCSWQRKDTAGRCVVKTSRLFAHLDTTNIDE
jgi:hypothetical protein